MSIPCTQETTISHMSKTLDRMERTQDRVIELLEAVSNQDARIGSLEEHTKKCSEHADILFERVRDLELNQATAPLFRDNMITSIKTIDESIDSINDKIDPLVKRLDKLNRFFYVTTHKYALIVLGVFAGIVLFGFFMDVLYHLDKIKAVIGFIRG